jgi:MmyB-like transcription regulator ligand binding domain
VNAALQQQRPFPAYVIDRHWNVVASNNAVPELYEGVSDRLMRPPINVVRMLLHPEGFGSRLINRGDWRTHLLSRLRRQMRLTADDFLARLWEEAAGYPGERGEPEKHDIGPSIPMIVMTPIGQLSFIGATTVFGSPLDVTLEEIALELLYPADPATDRAVRAAAGQP